MDYNVSLDIKYIKELLKINDSDLAIELGISRSTLFRISKNNNCDNKTTLEKIYSYAYKNKIRLNLINEELYKSEEDDMHKVLCHGSKEGLIGEPSIIFSNEKKDFGKGFYLGESIKQASSFVSNYPNSCIYMYSLDLTNLNIKYFDVEKDWMILIAYFRGRIDEYKDSKYLKSLLKTLENVDVVIAPIADNSMYSIINEFIEGSITDLQCLNSLSANRLGKQYVILNNDILKTNLHLLKQCYICSLEKEDYEKAKIDERNIGKSKMILAKRKYAGKGKYIEQLLK